MVGKNKTRKRDSIIGGNILKSYETPRRYTASVGGGNRLYAVYTGRIQVCDGCPDEPGFKPDLQ